MPGFHFPTLVLLYSTQHHSVLARPKRQGAAPCRFFLRPVVFPQRPVVFQAPFCFPSGFQHYFGLERAEERRNLPECGWTRRTGDSFPTRDQTLFRELIEH